MDALDETDLREIPRGIDDRSAVVELAGTAVWEPAAASRRLAAFGPIPQKLGYFGIFMDFVAGWFELGPARFEYCPGADRQRPPNENVFLPLRTSRKTMAISVIFTQLTFL
jgi:hypothetical protein